MKRIGTVLAILALFSLPQLGRAQTYWLIEQQTGQLCRVEVSTLTGTVVGNLGVAWRSGGIGFAPNGTLYGWNPLADRLYTINTSTGAATLVGLGDANAMNTFDINLVDGRAYGIGSGTVGRAVHEVNLATGATTLVANITPNTQITASAFSANGTWFGWDTNSPLVTINQNTGSVTTVGATGLSGNFANLGYDFVSNQLYSIPIQDPNFPLFRIDPTTGASTFLGNVSGLPGGANQVIAAGTFQISAVPEPGTVALVSMAAIGLGVAWYWKRRKPKKIAYRR